MKKCYQIILFAMLITSFNLFSADLAITPKFQKIDFYLTPTLGFTSYSIPFGINVEYAVTENIGVGGSLNAEFWSEDFTMLDNKITYSSTLITPAVFATYHFTKLKVDKLDLFGGIAIGYSIYSDKLTSGETDSMDFISKSSGMYVTPFAAARYYIAEKIAVYARLDISSFGSFTGFGGDVGVSFKL